MMFEGFVIAETDRALLFQSHYWLNADWLPRSQITILREIDTHEIRVLASNWICLQKNIEEFKMRNNEDVNKKEW